MSPPSRPPLSSDYPMDEHSARHLEITVLTQMRDNMAQMAADLRKQGEKIDATNNNVISLLAARYDEQITEARRQFEKELMQLQQRLDKHEFDNKQSDQDQEIRIRDHDRLIARIGLGMAIAASLGGTALGAVIVFMIQQVLK